MDLPPAWVSLSVGVAASLGANAVWGRGIGKASSATRLDVTPRRQAFSIWGPIYALLLAAAAYAAADARNAETSRVVDPRAALAVGVAELLSAVWVPLFVRGDRMVEAGTVLALAAASAMTGVALAGGRAPTWTHVVCVQVAYALFAGWLLCAATLGVGIASKSLGVAFPSGPSILALGVGAAAAAVATRNPVMVAPALWALAWQPIPSKYAAASAVACVVGGAGAILRLL